MNTQEIITALDEELHRLRQVRELLAGHPAVRRGRPKGSLNKAQNTPTSFNPAEFLPLKRSMSPEGKERIAAAQRARWARQNATDGTASRKKAATKKAVPKAASVRSAAKNLTKSAKSGRPSAAVPAVPKRKVGRPAKDTTSPASAKSAGDQASAAAA